MRYSEDDLRAAAVADVISTADLGRLVAFLAKRQPGTPQAKRCLSLNSMRRICSGMRAR